MDFMRIKLLQYLQCLCLQGKLMRNQGSIFFFLRNNLLKVIFLILYSRPSFANVNYFGGPSKVPLRDSKNLRELSERNENGMMQIFSDVWLDHPLVQENFMLLFYCYLLLLFLHYHLI